MPIPTAPVRRLDRGHGKAGRGLLLVGTLCQLLSGAEAAIAHQASRERVSPQAAATGVRSGLGKHHHHGPSHRRVREKTPRVATGAASRSKNYETHLVLNQRREDQRIRFRHHRDLAPGWHPSGASNYAQQEEHATAAATPTPGARALGAQATNASARLPLSALDGPINSLGKVGCIAPVDISVPANLEFVLKQRSYRNELIMFSTDERQAELALNFIMQLRALNIENWILLASDQALCERLGALVRGIGCVWSSFELHYRNATTGRLYEPDVGAKVKQRPAGGRSAHALWTERKHFLQLIAGMGYNVFQTDTDVMLLADPYPMFKGVLRDRNFVLQYETGCPRFNTGLMYVQNLAPNGPVNWILQEMMRRTTWRTENIDAALNEADPPHGDHKGLAAELAEIHGPKYPKHRYAPMMTHEQDMQNDVISSAISNETEVYHTFKALQFTVIDHKYMADPAERERQRQQYVALHSPKKDACEPYHAKQKAEGAPVRLCKAMQGENLAMGSSHNYQVLHVPDRDDAEDGSAGPLRETVAEAPLWIFGQQNTPHRYASSGCMNESGVLRSSWEETPPTIGAAVWHTVGPTHEVRKVLMRAFGYWHYYPSDFFKPAFPLDATRVLSLAPTLPSGLRLSSKDAFMKLIRRLATLAAASGRAVAHPLVECGDVFLKDGDFIPVPCPNSKTPCCFYTKGIELPFCPRSSLVYPPEVFFLLKFLNADEHATIVTRDLYEPSDSASAGSVDKDPNTWDWISDEWNTKASSAPEGTSLKVAHDLLLNKQLVFLNVSGLSNANGDEVLRNLPAKLSMLGTYACKLEPARFSSNLLMV